MTTYSEISCQDGRPSLWSIYVKVIASERNWNWKLQIYCTKLTVTSHQSKYCRFEWRQGIMKKNLSFKIRDETNLYFRISVRMNTISYLNQVSYLLHETDRNFWPRHELTISNFWFLFRNVNFSGFFVRENLANQCPTTPPLHTPGTRSSKVLSIFILGRGLKSFENDTKKKKKKIS